MEGKPGSVGRGDVSGSPGRKPCYTADHRFSATMRSVFALLAIAVAFAVAQEVSARSSDYRRSNERTPWSRMSRSPPLTLSRAN